MQLIGDVREEVMSRASAQHYSSPSIADQTPRSSERGEQQPAPASSAGPAGQPVMDAASVERAAAAKVVGTGESLERGRKGCALSVPRAAMVLGPGAYPCCMEQQSGAGSSLDSSLDSSRPVCQPDAILTVPLEHCDVVAEENHPCGPSTSPNFLSAQLARQSRCSGSQLRLWNAKQPLNDAARVARAQLDDATPRGPIQAPPKDKRPRLAEQIHAPPQYFVPQMLQAKAEREREEAQKKQCASKARKRKRSQAERDRDDTSAWMHRCAEADAYQRQTGRSLEEPLLMDISNINTRVMEVDAAFELLSTRRGHFANAIINSDEVMDIARKLLLRVRRALEQTPASKWDEWHPSTPDGKVRKFHPGNANEWAILLAQEAFARSNHAQGGWCLTTRPGEATSVQRRAVEIGWIYYRNQGCAKLTSLSFVQQSDDADSLTVAGNLSSAKTIVRKPCRFALSTSSAHLKIRVRSLDWLLRIGDSDKQGASDTGCGLRTEIQKMADPMVSEFNASAGARPPSRGFDANRSGSRAGRA